MNTLKAKIVRVQGLCHAGFAVDEEFQITEYQILPCSHSKTCALAFASLVNSLGRMKIENQPILISCPDPGTGEGGNVIFKLYKGES